MADYVSIQKQFQGVENSPPPTEEQRERVVQIRAKVLDLAHVIDQAELSPRYRAEALTNLETAAMFAVKGVFQ